MGFHKVQATRSNVSLSLIDIIVADMAEAVFAKISTAPTEVELVNLWDSEGLLCSYSSVGRARLSVIP